MSQEKIQSLIFILLHPSTKTKFKGKVKHNNRNKISQMITIMDILQGLPVDMPLLHQHCEHYWLVLHQVCSKESNRLA